MSKQVFISLPVADLPRSMAFFQALGYAPNPAFSGDEAACIVINDTTFVMLLSHAKWRGMTTKAICDARQSAEVSINLACESREQVIGLMAKAVAAGGTATGQPEDHGFMYQHGFADPDGHEWGLFAMSGTPPQA
ncbi:MAG TPA: VOC family protein [Lacunisphaera sp.]